MAHSFGVVEEKLLESEFFLRHFQESRPATVESRYYFSAFVSAARSVTFALQFSLNGIEGFEEWFVQAQQILKADALAPHFVQIRNGIEKKGVNPLNVVPQTHLREYMFSQLVNRSSSHTMVLASARSETASGLINSRAATDSYFRLLASLVFGAYDKFKTIVDPRWYYTQESFEAQGRTLADAVVELGFPPSWAAVAPNGQDAWRVIRAQQPACALIKLFRSYLGKVVVEPDEAA